MSNIQALEKIASTFIKTFGGNNRDCIYSINQTTDGGYILVGVTLSNNSGDMPAIKGAYDALVIKLNKDGNLFN